MKNKFIKDVTETKTFRREISKLEIFVNGQNEIPVWAHDDYQFEKSTNIMQKDT
jgi:hypothetical protein